MKIFKKKTLTLFAVLLSALFIVAACGNSSETSTSESSNESSKESSSENNGEQIKLKVANYAANTSPMFYAFVEPWMEKVTEYSNGQVVFDYYPSEQLGKAGDLLDLTKMGAADISVIVPDYTPDQMPIISFLSNYPGLGESVNQATLAINKLIQESEAVKETDFISNGVHPIMAFVPPGDDLWMIEDEVRKPEDLNGLKIRTVGGTINSLYEHLGATPISIPFSEVYEALERGVVDGAATYAMALKNGGFGELVYYNTPLQMGNIIHTLTINENVWQGLPADIQEVMMQAAEEVTAALGAVYDQETQDFMDDFLKDATLVELTDDEKEQWNQAFNEWGQAWLEENSDKGLPYEQALEEYRQYLEEFKE